MFLRNHRPGPSPHHGRRPGVRILTVLAAALAALPLVFTATSASAAPPSGDSGWQAKTPPLSTPWTSQVGPGNALPEYPRPQLTRARWQNLNGVWQFASAAAGETPPFGQNLAERILVPYPVESALSGIMRHEDRMWYRRTFTVPANWRAGSGQRLLLHFGAVDYDATVYVNGVQVAHHLGGYDAFSADITGALRGTGPQELVVGVYDPTQAGWQPLGKQRTNRYGGIFYTPTSGIWQTVWMEPVSPAHVDSLGMTPDLSTGTLRLTVNASDAAGDTVVATAYDGHRPVGTVTGPANAPLQVPVPNAKLWSPGHPFLYNLKVVLRPPRPGAPLDRVGSYFGMRSIALGKGRDGKLRMMLNGKFVFEVGTLDQGFWPDGIYAAPTDDALKSDLQAEKDLGFNLVRKHIKVEPDRWYYWADKLGMLVWQDMPSMENESPLPPPSDAQAEFESELHRMIDLHRNHPSIIMWDPFNEGWGMYDVQRIASEVKAWDPSRLVDAVSGAACCSSPAGSDVYDDHTYVGPGTPMPNETQAAVEGEYGGLGLTEPGHMWFPDGFAWEMEPDAATLTGRYVGLQRQLLQDEKLCGLSASIYTQITDVEEETDGLYTYDRKVLKMDAAQVRNANQALIRASATADIPGGSCPAN